MHKFTHPQLASCDETKVNAFIGFVWTRLRRLCWFGFDSRCVTLHEKVWSEMCLGAQARKWTPVRNLCVSLRRWSLPLLSALAVKIVQFSKPSNLWRPTSLNTDLHVCNFKPQSVTRESKKQRERGLSSCTWKTSQWVFSIFLYLAQQNIWIWQTYSTVSLLTSRTE